MDEDVADLPTRTIAGIIQRFELYGRESAGLAAVEGQFRFLPEGSAVPIELELGGTGIGDYDTVTEVEWVIRWTGLFESYRTGQSIEITVIDPPNALPTVVAVR